MFQPFWENQSQARAQGIDGYSTVYNIHSSNSRFVRVVNNLGGWIGRRTSVRSTRRPQV